MRYYLRNNPHQPWHTDRYEDIPNTRRVVLDAGPGYGHAYVLARNGRVYRIEAESVTHSVAIVPTEPNAEANARRRILESFIEHYEPAPKNPFAELPRVALTALLAVSTRDEIFRPDQLLQIREALTARNDELRAFDDLMKRIP